MARISIEQRGEAVMEFRFVIDGEALMESGFLTDGGSGNGSDTDKLTD
jgi:hypothetical protein